MSIARHLLEVEAETLEKARAEARARVPAGLCLLAEKVVSDGLPKTSKGVADTVEAAYAAADRQVPAGSRILGRKELIAASQRVITVEAPDESTARAQIAAQAGESGTIKSLHLVDAGRRRFLVFGKSSNVYKARVVQNVVVEVTYRMPARVAATYGELPAAGLALAVMGYAEGPGRRRTFKGTDADGQSIVLDDLVEGAILFVPKDTLRHLRQDEALWRRVSNPSPSDTGEQPPEERQHQGMGAFAGVLESVAEAVVAGPLHPREFRVSVVNTLHDAQLRVAALRTIRLQ